MDSPFPKFPSYHPWQEEALTKIKESWAKVIFLEGPTGSGKSLIGMSMAYQQTKALYLCTTKTLQSQLSHDYQDYQVLMGRSNYPCVATPILKAAFPEISCDDCPISYAPKPQEGQERGKDCKARCLYEQVKNVALKSKISILNTAYWLTEVNNIGRFADVDLVVIDECDILESQLMGYIEIIITQRMIERLGLGKPRYKTKLESWKEWAAVSLPQITSEEAKIRADMGHNPNPKILKLYKSVRNLHAKIKFLISSVNESWVYEDKSRTEEDFKISFKPVWVSGFGISHIWQHARRFLCMSGTILNAARMADTLGLKSDDWTFISIPSHFPVDRRPVYYLPVANFTHQTAHIVMGDMTEKVKEIIDTHPNTKGLIHTVSYNYAQYLVTHIKSDRFVYHNGAIGRQVALDQFKLSPDPMVLVSPSMDRGVDLPHDFCRWVVLIKIPYPSLGDKQISTRLYSSHKGQLWYAWVTACNIVQMTGRAMRAINDSCDCYILDQQFEKFYSKWGSLFPEWWVSALIVGE